MDPSLAPSQSTGWSLTSPMPTSVLKTKRMCQSDWAHSVRSYSKRPIRFSKSASFSAAPRLIIVSKAPVSEKKIRARMQSFAEFHPRLDALRLRRIANLISPRWRERDKNTKSRFSKSAFRTSSALETVRSLWKLRSQRRPAKEMRMPRLLICKMDFNLSLKWTLISSNWLEMSMQRCSKSNSRMLKGNRRPRMPLLPVFLSSSDLKIYSNAL